MANTTTRENLTVTKNHALAIAVDTLKVGVHFLEDTPKPDILYKALAVNLSDLAAMGAVPLAADIAIVSPEDAGEWRKHLDPLAAHCPEGITLCDYQPGPVSITVHAYGEVPRGSALLRSGAAPGDQIFVSGTLGDAGYALTLKSSDTLDHHQALRQRLHRPTPRLDIGLALRNVASAAIDVSDGLAADLGHILAASNTGATIHVSHLPISEALKGCIDAATAQEYALRGGDDYELIFTVPAATLRVLQDALRDLDTPVTKIGTIEAGRGLRILSGDGKLLDVPKGYTHF